MANNLLVNINEPINIDKRLVGMWISISWERKSDIDDVPSFFTFDAGVILSYKQNSFNIFYEDVGKIYNVKLQRNNWFKCLETPPTRPYQWRLLSKKVSLVPFNFLESFQCTICIFLQVDVILQHEQNELNDNLLVVDTNQPKLSKELIGRWISIAYNRECFGEDILVYDVGEIMDVKKYYVFVDYKTEGGITLVPLQSNNFNCSITDPPSRQYMWRMLLHKQQTIKRNSKRMRLEY